jgi:hypothetical protein
MSGGSNIPATQGQRLNGQQNKIPQSKKPFLYFYNN